MRSTRSTRISWWVLLPITVMAPGPTVRWSMFVAMTGDPAVVARVRALHGPVAIATTGRSAVGGALSAGWGEVRPRVAAASRVVIAASRAFSAAWRLTATYTSQLPPGLHRRSFTWKLAYYPSNDGFGWTSA
jgi:hypothetical protein